MIYLHYAPTSGLILDKKTYLHWLGHYFHLKQLIRACCFLVSCDIARKNTMKTGVDIRKEGFALLLRTSQKWFKKNLENLTDTEVTTKKCMSLRLQSDTARAIFDTKWLLVISHEDPLRHKVIMHGHELGLGTFRRTHTR